MEALKKLEEKIVLLIDLVDSISAENKALHEKCEALSNQQEDLKNECAVLAEENAQLVAQISEIEGRSVDEDTRLQSLEKEKEQARQAVDQLLERLKLVDSFVEERQQ